MSPPKSPGATLPDMAQKSGGPAAARVLSRHWVMLALIATALAGLIASGLWWQHNARTSARASAAYVDNGQCLDCHQDQARQWQQSHHAIAMAAPTPTSVRADFNNTTFTHNNLASHFFMRDGKYFVNTDGPDGKLADFKISYTFGVAPLQQYLIALPGGRLQALQIAWDTQRKRWFQLQPNEKAHPDDVLHWAGRYQTANTMCLTCHTTGFEKHYDATSNTFASHWAEPNVSCQSCHGPGAQHVQWAKSGNKDTLAYDASNKHHGLLVSAQSLTGKQQVELCSTCHSRRSELDATPVPGEPRLDNYLPRLLTEGLYHADGQQRDEVFVDGSFRQSKMYQKGVTCTNCHNAHTGKLKLTGNAVCQQCHQPPGNPAFPTAAGNYNSPLHHFHKEGSSGAQCASCHMPAKKYMETQPRPDHSIRIPRPDLTVRLGTPNACNNCHAGKSAKWATYHVAAWYGPNRRQETHYGEIFAAARAGRPDSNQALAILVADMQMPAIVRATALDMLRGDETTGIDTRISATRDQDPEVRAAAADSFETVPARQRIHALTPLLSDRFRAVRIAAARSLSSLSPDQLSIGQRRVFESALAEYLSAQSVSLDMPGAQLNLAVVYQNIGQLVLAEQHYLNALRIDPDFTPARVNLANLYNATTRNAEAIHTLTDGLKRRPNIGELQYSRALLLAEENRLPEAADALTKAAKLLPDRARVHYNLGLALQRLNQWQPAEAALLKSHRLEPSDPEIIYALVIFYAQSRQPQQAKTWMSKLQALAADNPQASELLESLTGRGADFVKK